MCGMNITQCPEERCECLGKRDCCFECDHRSYCDGKCDDVACHVYQIQKRINQYVKKKSARDW